MVLPVWTFLRVSRVKHDLDDTNQRLRVVERLLERSAFAAGPLSSPAASRPPAASDGTEDSSPALRETPVRLTSAAPPQSEWTARPQRIADRRANIESEIGSRLMLIVGVVVLVLGVGFFVKYAFDSQWITVTARIAIGTVAGIGAWLLGLRFAAAGYAVYGRLVAGGGLSMVYLSAYAATALYGLVPDAVGFGWMAGVSAVTALTADRQRSAGLASTALTLGYAAPFLVPGERDQHVVLFVYDTTLALAAYVLVRRHQWPFLGLAAFYLTWATFAAWAARSYSPDKFLETELYLTVVCAIFVAVAREYQSLEKAAQFRPALVAVGPALYHVASVWVLSDHSIWLLVYFIAFTAAGLAVARDRPAGRLLLWFAVMLPFFGWLERHTAASWYVATLATAAALYVMHLAAQWRMLRGGGEPSTPEVVLFHVNGLGPFASTYRAVYANAGSTTMLAAAIAIWHGALVFAAWSRAPAAIPHAMALAFAFTATAVALAATAPWVTVGWAAEGAAVVWVGLAMRRTALRYGGALLLALAAARLVLFQFAETISSFRPLLNARTAVGAFIVALMYAVAALERRYLATGGGEGGRGLGWVVAANALTVGLLTADINSFWAVRDERVAAAFARELTISLTWAVYAMGLIALGFWRSSPMLRYLALGLFGLTVAKMFAVDLRELDGAYRVAGFVTLGLVLLIASFLYQRRLPKPTAR